MSSTSLGCLILSGLYLLSFTTKVEALPGQVGSNIAINDKVEEVSWRQWQQDNQIHTAISDPGLESVLGVETLSNESYALQMVQWFSLKKKLPVSFEYPYRYLDVTELLKAGNLETQIAGDKLLLRTPLAKINALENKGNTLTLYLDRLVFWQIDQATVTLRALPVLPISNNGLFTIKTYQEISQVHVDLPAGYHLSVIGETGSTGYKLIIEMRPDAMIAKTIKWQPGITLHRDYIKTLAGDSFAITYLEIDPKIFIAKPIFSNSSKIIGLARLGKISQKQMAIAGINGGFFDRISRQPLGAIKRDRIWFSSPILNRGAVAWDDNGNFKFGRTNWQANISSNEGIQIPLVSLNSGYIQPGVSVYTPAWDDSYKPSTGKEIVFLVKNDQIQEKIAVSPDSSSIPIPQDGYLVVQRDLSQSLFKIGSSLQINEQSQDFANFPNILGAGPLLLNNGNIVLDAQLESFKSAFQKQNASRSGIGITRKGTVLLIAVHERIHGTGPSLSEFAQLMKQLDIIDGLNLDGGSSTSLYLGGQTIDQPLTPPSKVNNTLNFFKK